MAKNKKKKPASRGVYEAKHPVVSCRLDVETHKSLMEHLHKTRRSLGDLVKEWLGKEISMIEKRVEELAQKKAPPSLEEELKCIRHIVYDAALHCYNHEEPPTCPHCLNQELRLAWGYEKRFIGKIEGYTPVLRCPKCLYYPDTYFGIASETIKWDQADTAKSQIKQKSPQKRKHIPKKE